MSRLIAALACLSLVAGCATTDPQPPLPPQPPEPPVYVPPDQDCERLASFGKRIEVTPVIARVGTDLTLRAAFADGPAGMKPIPASCLSNWTVSNPAWASFSADHATLTLHPGAPAGETLTIGVEHLGKRFERTIRLVGRDEVVLTGFWSQQSVTCTSPFMQPEAVRELEFTDGGGFNVTYLPFESYVDFWGRADVNLGAGTVGFTVTGGNDVPGWEAATARAQVDGEGRLHVDGVVLDSAPQGETCDYIFARR